MDLEKTRLYIELATMVFSFIIAFFIAMRYRAKHRRHLRYWIHAWLLVAFRVSLGVLMSPMDLRTSFVYDVLTIGHDLLWLRGIMVLLDVDRRWEVHFPVAFLAAFASISAILYLVIQNVLYGSVLSSFIAHPALIFTLFFFFYIAARESGKIGPGMVSGAFLLWGIDYMIFGTLYFGTGNQVAGVIGWSIGLLFRIMALIGFYLMNKGK